jgi:hypothetical protein
MMALDGMKTGVHSTNSFACYGRHAALTLLGTQHADKRFYTVNVQLAAKSHDGRTFAWKDGINTQLNHQELFQLSALLLGYAPYAEFKREDKGVSFERQDGSVYVNGTARGSRPCSLPVLPGDVFLLSSLCLSQIAKNTPLSDGSLVLAAIRGAASLLQQKRGQ